MEMCWLSSDFASFTAGWRHDDDTSIGRAIGLANPRRVSTKPEKDVRKKVTQTRAGRALEKPAVYSSGCDSCCLFEASWIATAKKYSPCPLLVSQREDKHYSGLISQ